jgi:anti-anti-sigma factor
MDMAFSIVERSGYRIVTVTGDIDRTNAADFKLACSSRRRIVVDLLQCTYIDSVGLHVLIVASRTQELELVLTPISRIHRIFAITHLFEHFTIVKTVNEAIARVAGRRSLLPSTLLAPSSVR